VDQFLANNMVQLADLVESDARLREILLLPVAERDSEEILRHMANQQRLWKLLGMMQENTQLVFCEAAKGLLQSQPALYAEIWQGLSECRNQFSL